MFLGGKSGHGARPLDPAWVTDIRDQCLRAKIPFFFKQWGGKIGNPMAKNRELRGVVYNEFPVWSKI